MTERQKISARLPASPGPSRRPALATFCAVLVFAFTGIYLSASPAPVGAAATCAAAPAHLATAGIDPVGGVGGTGRGADPGEGGIGGTGIIGTVTGFASVCVNGVEVHYDNKVPVAENGRASSVAALAVGQVVALDAAQGRLGLTARRIEVVHALEGPVTRSGAGRLEVMGAPVLPADPSARSGAEALRPGDWAQVSGHRDETGRWVATRVAKIEPRPEVTLQGVADQEGRFAGVRLAIDSTVAAGATRLVRGVWQAGVTDNAGRVQVRESVASPAALIVERADRVIVETRIREVRDGRARSGHPEIDATLTGRPVREGDLIRIRGHRASDGRIVADRLERQAVREPGDRTLGDRREDDARRESDREQDGARQRDRNEAERERKDERNSPDRDRNGRDRSERSERNERADRAERVERSDRRNRD